MKGPDKIFIHSTVHLRLLSASEIDITGEDEQYIRKDVVEHIIRAALGPQDVLNKIRSL